MRWKSTCVDLPGDRVDLHVADHRVPALAGARELEQEDPVLAAALLKSVEQGLARHLDGDRLLAAAVDDGRNHRLRDAGGGWQPCRSLRGAALRW